MVGNECVIQQLESMAKSRSLTHLILSGPSGVGKNTSIDLLSDALFQDLKRSSDPKNPPFKEFNASDERGINDIRGEIGTFARSNFTFPEGALFQKKIIFLDEADSLTPQAQKHIATLMATTEKQKKQTIFVFACNDGTKLLQTIKNKCRELIFKKIVVDEMLCRLEQICHTENVYPQKGILKAYLRIIADRAEGDLRKAIEILETSYYAGKMNDVDELKKFLTSPEDRMAYAIFDACVSGDFRRALQKAKEFTDSGFDPSDLLSAMDRVIRDSPISDEIKFKFAQIIGECASRILEGLANEVQFKGFIAKLCRPALE